MPRRTLTALTSLTAALALAPAASAAVPHTVAPGETLWSIAAANNFTTRSLAAYNGLSPEAHVVLGSTVQIPAESEAAAALAATGATTGASTGASTGAGAPPAQGAYTVRPGDTLSALAARAGVPVAQMAYMNGLDPDGILPAGTLLKLPTGAPTPAGADTPAPAQVVVPAADPVPTGTRLSAHEVQHLAAEQGAPSDLAAAIGWQESGFNNAMVSSANARGIMQVMPGTWDWVQQNLTQRRLDPSSAADNVRAGALYLNQLLRETGGDPALAAAGYYQGLASVRRIGMLPETRRYVDNVLALRQRFGG
jgi:LysM repeat protein